MLQLKNLYSGTWCVSWYHVSWTVRILDCLVIAGRNLEVGLRWGCVMLMFIYGASSARFEPVGW